MRKFQFDELKWMEIDGVTSCMKIREVNKNKKQFVELRKSEFVERFLELSLFYGLSSPLNSEMICIFPYFCPYAESAREIREFFI